MFSTVSLVAILWLASLIQIGSADNAFCGCQNSLTSTYITMQPPAGQTRYTSATQCQQVCYIANNPTPAVVGRTNYRHSLYKASDGTCLCTDKYQNVQGQTNGFADACSNPADFDDRIVQTTFVKYPDCYAAAPQGIVMSQINGPDSCSIKCATSLHMVFWMNQRVSRHPTMAFTRTMANDRSRYYRAGTINAVAAQSRPFQLHQRPAVRIRSS